MNNLRKDVTSGDSTTLRRLALFKDKELKWGNISIPYGPVKNSPTGYGYHLPAGITEIDPLEALTKMFNVYIAHGIKVDEIRPTRESVDEYLASKAEIDASTPLRVY